MRTLILSANTGQGHNSCAEAIKTAAEKYGDYCEIQDVIAYISPEISKIVSKCHVGIYRKIPWSNRLGYEFSEKHPSMFKKGSPLYGIFLKGAKDLANYIDEKKFDIIVACHVFAAVMLTPAGNLCSRKIKSCHISTDYTCSPGTAQSDLDFYFIPAAQLKSEFENAGVPEERIVPSGIPVRSEFFYPADKYRAKKYLGIKPDEKHLIIMCGSMGGGPIYDLAVRLSKSDLSGIQISIICGTNSALKKSLEKKFAEYGRFHIYGYVGNMSAFMDAADLYLTKPGGISVTEAAVKNLPMVFVNSVAGCEDHNFMYFIAAGGAVSAKRNQDIAELCILLLRDEDKLLRMSSALKTIVPGDPAKEIYETLVPGSI